MIFFCTYKMSKIYCIILQKKRAEHIYKMTFSKKAVTLTNSDDQTTTYFNVGFWFEIRLVKPCRSLWDILKDLLLFFYKWYFQGFDNVWRGYEKIFFNFHTLSVHPQQIFIYNLYMMPYLLESFLKTLWNFMEFIILYFKNYS